MPRGHHHLAAGRWLFQYSIWGGQPIHLQQESIGCQWFTTRSKTSSAQEQLNLQGGPFFEKSWAMLNKSSCLGVHDDPLYNLFWMKLSSLLQGTHLQAPITHSHHLIIQQSRPQVCGSEASGKRGRSERSAFSYASMVQIWYNTECIWWLGCAWCAWYIQNCWWLDLSDWEFQ